MNSAWSQIMIPTDTSYLKMVCDFVRSVCEKEKIQVDIAHQLELAVDEVISHVITSDRSPWRQGYIVIACTGSPYALEVIVTDQGKPFDPSLVSGFDLDRPMYDSGLSGLGLFLAKKVMDEFQIINRGQQGAEFRMIKYRTMAPPEGFYPPEESAPHDAYPEIEYGPTDAGVADYADERPIGYADERRDEDPYGASGSVAGVGYPDAKTEGRHEEITDEPEQYPQDVFERFSDRTSGEATYELSDKAEERDEHAADYRPVEVKRPEIAPLPDMSYRIAEASEASTVSRLTYKVKGESYARKVIYVIRRIETMIAQKELVVGMAFSGDQPVGAIPIFRTGGEQYGTFHGAILRNDFMNEDQLRSLMDTTFNEVLDNELRGIRASIRCDSALDQHILFENGFVPTALWSGSLPPSKGSEESAPRNSEVFYFLSVKRDPGLKIYVPQQREELFRAVYDRIGLERDFVVPSGDQLKPTAMQSHVRATVKAPMSSAHLVIEAFSEALVGDLGDTIKRLRQDMIKSIVVELNLTDPISFSVITALETLGFFSGGVIPNGDEGDLAEYVLLTGGKVNAGNLAKIPGLIPNLFDAIPESILD